MDKYHARPAVEKTLGKHLIFVKVDVVENPGGEELYKKYTPQQGGVPVWVVLSADAKVLADSFEDGKKNVGFPYYPNELTHYERVMRAAFEGARKRRKKVTSITKSNAQQFGMVLWDEVFKEVAQSYPDVQTGSLLIDAAAMDFVRKPETFDVVVASNLFGDILTDLSAIVTGSVGLAASGNINPERTAPSMFEPVHGSAPDIAGKGIANPLAAILSAGLLLEHLGAPQGAAAIRRAVAAVLKAGKTRTPDLGGNAKTIEMAEAVLAAL